MKIMVGWTSIVLVALLLTACDEEVSPNGSTSEEEPWEPPTDGRWPGTATEPLYGYEADLQLDSVYGPTWSVRVDGPADFSGHDGRKVTMSQTLIVTRLGDAAEFDAVWPTHHGGVDEAREGFYSEDSEADVICDSSMPNVGDRTVCTISARPDADDVINSYWSLHLTKFAAWPGQETIID